MKLNEFGLYENKCRQCGDWFYTTDKYKMICGDCDGEIYDETYQETCETYIKEKLDRRDS